MAEYIDREIALSHPFANGRYDRKNANPDFILGYESFKEWLENLPAANVRPVVLCDKCIWFTDTGYPEPDPEMPELRMGYCFILSIDVQACWFCASGKRKGGDAE